MDMTYRRYGTLSMSSIPLNMPKINDYTNRLWINIYKKLGLEIKITYKDSKFINDRKMYKIIYVGTCNIINDENFNMFSMLEMIEKYDQRERSKREERESVCGTLNMAVMP
jgi:hypothetical protein